ncbi:MAG: lipoyl(octanoyl) transferase LipB [Pseudomonadota bacterium]
MSRPAASSTESASLIVRSPGLQAYDRVFDAMRRFTDERTADTADEIWFTEHPPIFTLGLNAAREHVLAPGDIPVINVDRGGQVTYHGPGQLMIYPLIDLRRAGLGVRDTVTALEQAVIALLGDRKITAECRANAPGVYVDDRKVASVGLRVRRGATYHGMALNVAMNLEPFSRINPCGYAGLEVTDLRTLGWRLTLEQARDAVLPLLLRELGLDDTALETSDGLV